MKNTLIVGAITVVVAVLLSAMFIKPVQNVTNQVLGGSNAPSVVGGCMDVNGVSLCSYTQAFSTASTTCAFAAPTASSTLISATATILSFRGDSLGVEWGKAANFYATTTSLGYVAAVLNGTVHASSTPTVLRNRPDVFNAGQYLNFKVGSTTFSGTGTCSALFMSI